MTRRRHRGRYTPPHPPSDAVVSDVLAALRFPTLDFDCSACDFTVTVQLGPIDPCPEHGLHSPVWECPECGADNKIDLARYYHEDGSPRRLPL